MGVLRPSHLASINVPHVTVLMKGAIVMLTKNYIIENKVGLFIGAIGEVIGFGYPTKNGPIEQDLPDYVLVDF